MSKRKGIQLWHLMTALCMVSLYLFFRPGQQDETKKLANSFMNPGGLDKVILHYGDSIEMAATLFNLPAEYLKALCMLECSGRRIIKPRYEKHIYERLKKVQSRKIGQYEHVTPEMIVDATDEALKNLASSWGPFQLLGFKCLLLDIRIADIRGERSVYWGAKWINETYGNVLRSGQYKDAFHIHNTGRRFPRNGVSKTYDPNYVENGLKYMDFFSSK
jgi:hypothetical protein